MFDFLENSAFFGVAISVVSYGIGMLLKKKFKLAILNPLLISIVITIAFLALTGNAMVITMEIKSGFPL